jgi:hypothetical protein
MFAYCSHGPTQHDNRRIGGADDQQASGLMSDCGNRLDFLLSIPRPEQPLPFP